MVGFGWAGFATRHLTVIWAGVTGHELVPIHQSQRTAVVNNSNRVQLGCCKNSADSWSLVVCKSALGACCTAKPRKTPERDTRLDAGNIDTNVSAQDLRGGFMRVDPGSLLGPSQQIALPVGQIRIAQHPQVILCRNTFCYQLDAKICGNLF